MEQWISLTDYASKYRVSVSTLRRRIKADKITFRKDKGKYLLLDRNLSQAVAEKVPLKKSAKVSTPQVSVENDFNQQFDANDFDIPLDSEPMVDNESQSSSQVSYTNESAEDHDIYQNYQNPSSGIPSDSSNYQASPSAESKSSETFLSTKVLLDEIKKAYMTILQEKEEQLVQLKTEVTDLKTLVRALESENYRLQSIIKELKS